jgi:peptidoglycan/xylan/chitin deacetylase (PgdA/CDA1 family)
VARTIVAVGVLVFLVARPTGASPRSTLSAYSDTTTATSSVSEPAEPITAPSTIPSTTLPPTTLPPAPAPTEPRVTLRTRSGSRHYPPNSAPVALTFDDGPNAIFTPQVLDVLARYGVHATFFIVGSEADQLPDLVRRELDAGHAIGNHTWTHADLTTLDDAGFRDEVDRTEDVLATFAGHRPACVRPPFGRVNQFVRDELHARHLTMARWTTDTEDWKQPGVDAIVHRALAGAHPGATILMHDSGPDMSQTVEALPRIIEGILSRGLRLAPMCEGAAPASSGSGTTGPE